MRSWFVLACLIAASLAVAPRAAVAQEKQPASITGWRGNWTGRFPDANPVTTWSIKPKSPAWGLRYQATRPAKDDTGASTKEVWAGDVAAWLVLSGFNAKDPSSALDEAFVPDEASIQPAEGDQAGEQAWQLLALSDYQDGVRDPANQKKNYYGPYGLGCWPFGVRFITLSGKGANQVAYAHAYLYSQSAGTVCFILNHEDGLKAWVNGKEVYKQASRSRNFYAYELDHSIDGLTVPTPAPRFNAEFVKGWNRVLLKVARKAGSGCFALRITAPANAEYETTNIRWMTKMPDWSWSSPIVVKDRVFVTSEPDELVCVDKNTGKILWRRVNTVFDTVSPEERAKDPRFKEIELLAAELAKGVDKDAGTVLRRKIYDMLTKIDAAKYARGVVAHIPAIGFACPTPASDGQAVYAQFHPGVVVCYDLDGNRRWIASTMDLGYAVCEDGKEWVHAPNGCCSPAIVGDKLVVLKGWFRAFDRKTGKVAWDTGPINNDFWKGEGGVPNFNCPQSVLPGSVGGIDFVMGFNGCLVRASDGKVMGPPTHHVALNQFATPVIDGDTAYEWGVQKYKLTAEGGEIKRQNAGAAPSGGGMDCSSPLPYQGLVYCLSAAGVMSVSEAQTGKLLYKQQLEMTPLCHYNAIGATPSVALGGKHIFLMDNQGTCVVVAPGREFKQVARNRIDTMMQHPWPLTTIERFEASPVFDGAYMFIRGERNLYCIGDNKGK
ncbi:MAG: PQQ-binding-like beta-propeller repeat protein [Phycisphaerae bacterium]